MVNEVLQWTVLVVLIVLTLGLLRQLSVMLPPAAGGVGNGPSMGRRAPARLLGQVERAVMNGGLAHGALVAFVTEDCVGCQKLLADVADGRQKLDGQPLVVVARSPSEQFRAALRETGIAVVHDEGELWDECRVTATPLVVRIDEKGRIAMKEVTHRVDQLATVHQ